MTHLALGAEKPFSPRCAASFKSSARCVSFISMVVRIDSTCLHMHVTARSTARSPAAVVNVPNRYTFVVSDARVTRARP